MDNLHNSSSKALRRAEVNLHGKLKNYFLTHYSHFLVPGCNAGSSFENEWNIENVLRLGNEYPYSCDLPRPLLPPVKISRKKADQALQLIATKAQIDDSANRILDYYQKYKKSFISQPLKRDTQWREDNGFVRTSISRLATDLAVMMAVDPDRHFLGNYNWYYTGGSLDNITLGGKNILFFPYMRNLVAVPITLKSKGLWKPDMHEATGCKITEVFYELRKMMSNESCRILARSKNHCKFYSITDDHGQLRMIEIHQQYSKLPFVSADLDPINPNKFCTMNVDHVIGLWDITSCKKLGGGKIKTGKILEDNWGTVRFSKFDPHTLIVANRCCIHYLDTRQPFERPVLTLCLKGNLDSCESLCLEISSTSENHSYVGTYHSLLICDRRMHSHDCVQQKWIHQLKSPPLFASVQSREAKETIVLSSQLPGETAILLNTWGSYANPFTYNVPCTPPSIFETLREAQLQGTCLDPSLRRRLRFSIAGTALTADDHGELSLFRQNSAGDIFYQCITHDEMLNKFSLVNSQSYYAMEGWEKRILLQDYVVEPLIITERSNMHHIFDHFTDKSLVIERDTEPGQLLRDPNWKQTPDELKAYADILAPELMAVWEASEDYVPVSQAVVPHQKVINWLEMGSQKEAAEFQEEPESALSPINTQELYSVSQQPKFANIADSVPEESYYAPIKVKTSQKPQRKKKTYVAGF